MRGPALPRLSAGVRGIRVRLVIAYVIGATVAGVLGTVGFTYLLSDAVHTNVDADLRDDADAVAADVRAGRLDEGRARSNESGGHGSPPSSLSAVYDGSGTLRGTEPALLPLDPRPAASAAGYTTATYADRPFRFLRVAVPHDGGRWTVIVGASLASTHDATADATQALLVIVPIAIALSGLGAWLLSGAALRPVERMRMDAQELSDSGARGLIGVPDTSDGVARLALTFNGLLDRLQSSLERQRDFVADAGHELRTPLTVLQTELEMADRPGRSPDELADSIGHARIEVGRLASLAEDLLLLAAADSRSEQLVRRPTRLDRLVDECLDGHREHTRRAGITLRAVHHAASEPADIDPMALRRVLDNLITNAQRHTPDGGLIEIEDGDAADHLVLTVRDTGTGFPEEFLPHAFERFTRADASRHRVDEVGGSGLGLSIVWTLVAAHGGSVVARNAATGGAEVEIRLPRSADTGQASPPTPGTGTRRRKSPE